MAREPKREPLVSKLTQAELDQFPLVRNGQAVKTVLVTARSLQYRKPLHIGGSDALHLLASSQSAEGKKQFHIIPMYEEKTIDIDNRDVEIRFEDNPVGTWIEPGDQIALVLSEESTGWIQAADLEKAMNGMKTTAYFRAVSYGHQLGHDFIPGRLVQMMQKEKYANLPITYEQKLGPNGEWTPVDPKVLETRVAEWQKLGCSRTPTSV